MKQNFIYPPNVSERAQTVGNTLPVRSPEQGGGVAVLNFSRGLATMAQGMVTAGVQLRPVCFVMIDFLKFRKGLFLFNGGRTERTLSRAAAP